MFASDYDYDYNYSFFRQPKLLRGLYSILLVSLLMTIFEIVFYKLIIDPQTIRAVKNLLNSLSWDATFYTIAAYHRNNANGSVWQSPMSLVAADKLDLLSPFLLTTAQREEKLIAKLNLYAYVTASFMIFFLIAALFYVHTRLVYVEGHKHVMQVFGDDFGAALLTSVFTVLCLASFQILFYFFGTNFNFIGSKGAIELQNAFNNMLRRNLGMQEIE